LALRGEYWWVRLRPEGVDWARCLGGEERPRQEGQAAELEDVPAPAGARVVLCVPGTGVRVHRVHIPTRNRRRFRAALPFALEDQLLHDPEAFHFVPLPRNRGQADAAVAVVEHNRMAQWLEPVSAAGWQPRFLVPDYLAVAPPEAGVWLLDAAEPPFLLRLPRGGGGATLTATLDDALPGALRLALEAAAEAPSRLDVRVADRAQAARVAEWRPALEGLGVALQVQEDSRTRSAWLVRQPLPESGCNLLTGPYASGQDPRIWLRRLAPAAGLAAGLLAVAGGQWVLQGQELRARHHNLSQAIDDTYREAFPEARNLVDPRYQMEQRLERLRGQETTSSEGGGLLGRLRTVAPALAAGDNGKVRSLTYDQRGLLVEVSVADYEALEQLQERLAGAGEVSVENAELKEGRVHGRIRLREAG